MRAHHAILALLLVAGGTAVADEYIGAKRCRTCHEAEYAQWRKTPHARAAAKLTRAQRRDRRCASCHSTSAEQGLHGVQCESCHGPGEHYWPEHIMRDVHLARAVGLEDGAAEKICARCHTADAPTLRPFDHATALPKVLHGRVSERRETP